MNKQSTDFDDFHNMLFSPVEKHKGRVLEVGCGEGYLSNYIFMKGRSIVSLDIDSLRLIKAKQLNPYLNLIKGDAQCLPFPDNSFDIIISVENIEHLPNVDQHLFEVKRILKPNGIYLIKTPNKLWDTPYWVILKGQAYKELKKPGNHISTQTYHGLKRLLEGSDFNVAFLTTDLLHPNRKQNEHYGLLASCFKYINYYLPNCLKPCLFCVAVNQKLQS